MSYRLAAVCTPTLGHSRSKVLPPGCSYVMVLGSHSSGLEYPLLNAYVTRGRLLFIPGRWTVHTAPSEVHTRMRAMQFDEGIQRRSITPVFDEASFVYVFGYLYFCSFMFSFKFRRHVGDAVRMNMVSICFHGMFIAC